MKKWVRLEPEMFDQMLGLTGTDENNATLKLEVHCEDGSSEQVEVRMSMDDDTDELTVSWDAVETPKEVAK